MEHVLALVREAQLEDPALALALHDRVGVLDGSSDVPVGKYWKKLACRCIELIGSNSSTFTR